MDFRAISALQSAGFSTVQDRSGGASATPFRSVVSRRYFARGITATAALGTILGSEEEEHHRNVFPWTFAPVPIPKGTPNIGGYYHVFAPGPAPGSDPIDTEPATITNFKGFVGLAYLSGNVTQTNVETGEEHRYPFVESDMRFMQGTFRGTDGKEHQAAFALV